METAGTAFNATRDSALKATPAKGATAGANAALMQVERSLTRPEGLRTRPWYRNLIYVADENNGYSNMVFPSVNEAIRAGDQGLAQRELDDLVQRFGAATAAIERARAALVSR
jgi:N-acetylated-alpha-linked acidic dipeptidase